MTRKRMSDELSMSHMTRRILRAWDLAWDDQMERGRRWYPEAHELAEEIAEGTGLTVEAAAGLIAALSPAITWEENVKDARALAAPEDDPESWDGYASVSTYGQNRRKAIGILEGGDPDEILGGPKVRAFWRCIADPENADAVCVDRHGARVALGWKMSLGDVHRWLGRVGTIEKIQEAYRRAAAELGELPLVVQAVTWLVYRERMESAALPF